MSAIEQRFGPYGGRYVPETLIAALDELTAAWEATREDPEYLARLDGLRRDYVGRPTPLYLAERLSERVGSRVYLKREDLAHTGAHKINNALGQTLLAQRMGKSRIASLTASFSVRAPDSTGTTEAPSIFIRCTLGCWRRMSSVPM